jgi:hypothetical protein
VLGGLRLRLISRPQANHNLGRVLPHGGDHFAALMFALGQHQLLPVLPKMKPLMSSEIMKQPFNEL